MITRDKFNLWNLNDLAEATQGELLVELLGTESVEFDSVSTDTRSLQAGALYIAIKGERFDGHEFIAEAVRQGAVAVLISEPVETVVPAILVEDTRIALGKFAAWHRQQMPLKKLIAVTGSNGKTTTKNLIAHLLESSEGADKVLFTQGNFNNDFGVPRTLLEITPEHDYAVIEMGANHLHEIRYLTQLAQPDIALITLAAGAHLEGFGSLQGVIDTKGEIFEGLGEEGVGIINADSPGFDQWQAQLNKQGNVVKTFGAVAPADYQVTHFRQVNDGIQFQCHFDGEAHGVVMPILGEHNAMNAAAAIAVCMEAGFSWRQILPGLGDFSGVGGRLQQRKLAHGLLIDDSYNANPNSVKAAINTVAALPGKALACLGAMAELGKTSDADHAEVAAYAKQQGITHLLVFGDAAKPMIEAFGEGAEWFEDHQQLAQKAIALLDEKWAENCLVKGSRSATMEVVSQRILEHYSVKETLNN